MNRAYIAFVFFFTGIAVGVAGAVVNATPKPATVAAAPQDISPVALETPTIEQLIAALPASVRGSITANDAPKAPAPRPARPRPQRDEIALMIEGL